MKAFNCLSGFQTRHPRLLPLLRSTWSLTTLSKVKAHSHGRCPLLQTVHWLISLSKGQVASYLECLFSYCAGVSDNLELRLPSLCSTHSIRPLLASLYLLLFEVRAYAWLFSIHFRRHVQEFSIGWSKRFDLVSILASATYRRQHHATEQQRLSHAWIVSVASTQSTAVLDLGTVRAIFFIRLHDANSTAHLTPLSRSKFTSNSVVKSRGYP